MYLWQAVESERSSLLRTLADVRGQRHRLTRRLDEEEQERLAVKPAPVPSFVVATKWGEVSGGERVVSTGDEDAWMEASLAAKEDSMSYLSNFSGILAAHMPPLADIAEQRDELEEERQRLLVQLSDLKNAQRQSFAQGSLPGHSEKLVKERDALRHSWYGRDSGTINTSTWYHQGDFEQTGLSTPLGPR